MKHEIEVDMFDPITLEENGSTIDMHVADQVVALYYHEAQKLRDALIELCPLPPQQPAVKPQFYAQGRTVYQTKLVPSAGVWVAKFASNDEAKAYANARNHTHL